MENFSNVKETLLARWGVLRTRIERVESASAERGYACDDQRADLLLNSILQHFLAGSRAEAARAESAVQKLDRREFDSCIMCGQCERYCPTQEGIRMTTEWDNAGFAPEDFEDRIEKELLMCEVCGEVLAPADQLGWLVDRLGPLSFANPTLTVYSGMRQGYVEKGVRSLSDEPLRSDRMALQCPKCRRKTAYAA